LFIEELLDIGEAMSVVADAEVHDSINLIRKPRQESR